MTFRPFQETAVPGPKRDFVGYGRRVPRARWPNGARVAVSLVLNYEEGSEYAHPNGDGRNDGLTEVIYAMDPAYRDLCAESVFEYGARAGVWRVERLLSEYKIPITFFACAVALERNREVGAWVREAGHEPCCHGWRWEEVWRLSRAEEADHIRRAIDSIRETCGERPLGWYCRYGPSVNTRELLVEEGGFVYDSDAYNDDLPYFVDVGGKRQLVVPYSMTYNDGKFGLLPGYGSPADFLDNLKRGLDQLWAEGATHPRMMSVGLHPRLIGQASRVHALREFIDYALSKGGVWFCRRIDVARWWHDHHAEFAA
ncbi:MAG: polysaccharide deacetylase family protein [Acetobacteraceae bacterium]|nr:polysaccharide deacetylase family protein [Acetobacteraceae bacterium]